MQISIYAQRIGHHNTHVKNATRYQINLWDFLIKLNVDQKQ